jgi:hypothetical protein
LLGRELPEWRDAKVVLERDDGARLDTGAVISSAHMEQPMEEYDTFSNGARQIVRTGPPRFTFECFAGEDAKVVIPRGDVPTVEVPVTLDEKVAAALQRGKETIGSV